MKALSEIIQSGNKQEIESALESFAPTDSPKNSDHVQGEYRTRNIAARDLAEQGRLERRANPCRCNSKFCGYCNPKPY